MSRSASVPHARTPTPLQAALPARLLTRSNTPSSRPWWFLVSGLRVAPLSKITSKMSFKSPVIDRNRGSRLGVVGALVGHGTRGSGEDAKAGQRAPRKLFVRGMSRPVKTLGTPVGVKAIVREKSITQAAAGVQPNTMKPDKPRIDLLGLPLLPFLE